MSNTWSNHIDQVVPTHQDERMSVGDENVSGDNTNEKKTDEMTIKTCPICKKEKKNILLHIKKSKTCEANLSEEKKKMGNYSMGAFFQE